MGVIIPQRCAGDASGTPMTCGRGNVWPEGRPDCRLQVLRKRGGERGRSSTED